MQTYIAKQALIEANKLGEAGIPGIIDACMTSAGFEKHGGQIVFDHVRLSDEDGVAMVISDHERYMPEEVLLEVIYDNDPRAGLLITQDVKLN